MTRIFLILVILISLNMVVASAQSPNLLINGDMEGGFSARDNVTGVPLGWAFHKLDGNLDADRQAFAPYSHSSPTFWTMRGSYSRFLAAGRQTINNATPGLTYRAGVFVWVWTCDDNRYSCASDNGRFSQKESGARARIGIDPYGGSDPNSPNIAWGPWVQSFDVYTGITIDAVAQSNNVSIFLMADSGNAMAFNEFYWDDAFLQTVNAPAQSVNNPAAAAPQQNLTVNSSNFVPFVDPQQARPDGSVVHVVKEGDTLDSIAVAYYRTFGITKDQIIQANGWRFPPQYIRIGQEILIFPPGSVDPTTGQLNSGALANLPQQPPQTDTQAQAPATTGGQPVQPAQSPNSQVNGAGTVNNPNAGGGATTTQPQPTTSVPTMTSAEIAGIPAIETVSPFLPQ